MQYIIVDGKGQVEYVTECLAEAEAQVSWLYHTQPSRDFFVKEQAQ